MSRQWVHEVLAVLAWVTACWARAGTATRSLSSADYGLSETVTVTVRFAPLADEAFNTLEETVPAGWTLVSDGGGAWDAGTRRLRWLATGGLARTFSYRVQAPASGEATAVFSGTAAFDGSVVTVGGAATLPRRAPGTATRSFGGGATTYRPGVGVTVNVVVAPSNGTTAYGVEETLPAGWTASAVSDGGAFSGGKVTWPLFVDGLARTLGYTATAPLRATGAAAFGGVATFDGRTATTTGAGSLARAVDVAGTVTRSMPGTFHTGEPLAVTLLVMPGAAVLGYSVVEDLPEGWVARNASVSGTISQGGRRVTWGPFLDATARVLGYEAVPDAGTRGTGVFAGQADFGGTTAATAGVTGTSWVALEGGTVTRGLPGTCRVGVGFEVTLTAAPNEHVTLYTVREVVPEGYAVRIPAGTVGSPAGTYSAGTRTITWGPISHEGSPVTLRYELTAGAGAASSGIFAGTAVFGDVERTTGGPVGLIVLPTLMGTATRTLPGTVEPGGTATVRVVATPDVGIGLWVLDEVLPEGWTAGTLPAGASYDAGLRRIRFGPFNDDASRALEYTATAGAAASGPQTFAGTATFDGAGVSVGGAAAVLADGPPTLTTMLDQTVGEDGVAVLSFLAADDLTAAGRLVLTASSSNTALVPQAGLVLGTGEGGVRTLTMGLATNAHGASSITVSVSDGTSTTTRTFVLTVTPVNDAPVAAAVSRTALEDTAVALMLAGSDVDGDALTYVVVTPPTKGVLGGTGASRTYTPNPNANGTDSFTYRVSDGTLESAVATVTLTVTPVNDAPVAAAVSRTTLEDTAVGVTLAGSDVDGDALTYVVVTPPAKGVLSGTGASRTYTPNPNANGTDSFTYRVSDGALESAVATVTLTVTPVNDAPSFVKGANQVAWDDAGAVVVAGWATSRVAGPADEAGQTLAFEVGTTSPGLFAAGPTVSAAGALSFTPAAGARGVATVTVRLRDSGGTANGGVDLSAPQAFTVTVQVRPRVVGRWAFYNGSAFDGGRAAADAGDDGALAVGKSALRPGSRATFSNITSYSKGLNGVMVDVVGLPGTPTAADFGLRVGTGTNLASWVAGPVPLGVAVRRGAGSQGSDRVTLTWADAAIRNQWLEVRVRTGARTGLSGEDVFYLGNVVAETGDSALDLLVTSTDMNRIRLAVTSAPVGVGSDFDIDRNGWVNSTDVALARLNVTSDLRLEVKLLDLRGMAAGAGTGEPR